MAQRQTKTPTNAVKLCSSPMRLSKFKNVALKIINPMADMMRK